ncbi:unnamed protein product [Ceutorhynchus assimilis]|uniref:Galectin domain-containing protein n=1 Tax=Ceutorhynchus assimilis TaxID=467358 RepID=A0A9N9MGG3_9CUCU|nr:unnamed protein product [Ceutorhynchus assimilis]
MAEPIVNPQLPYIGEVPSGLQPGKMLRFQGVTHPDSDRFNINLATGPTAKPRDDTALHLSVRLNQGYIARNSYKDGAWGDEQGSGKLPIGQAQSFEIIILVDPQHYKIAVNGQHHSEFPHRIPYNQVTHLLVDGDVSLTLISFEGIPLSGNETSSQASAVHAEGPQFGGPQQYGPPPGAYGAPPPNFGGYGPPPPPGAEPQSQFGGFFEQAQDILAGAIKSGAAEKLLGSILHSSGQPQQQPQGYAHQNAKYGIYPDLPTQDSTPTQNVGNTQAQDATLSNLIAGAGGTVTNGPQPTQQNPSGPLEGLLMGLLSNKGGESQPNAAAPGQQQNNDAFSGFLSSLLSNGNQSQQPDNQAPQNPQGQDVLSGLFASLLAPKQDPQTAQGAPQAGNQSDALSGLLSSLVHSNKEQEGPNQPPQAPNQAQAPDALSGLLSSLLNRNQGPDQAPQTTSNVPPQPQGQQGPNQPGAEMLSNLLQGLLSKAGEQHNNTRPIQETNPAPPSGNPQQQQYGQYPHPAQQQEQRGPMESLLSGLLSGGGNQQQAHGPQVGGEGSVGGLGSMGGILGSLAGSFLNRNDHNQGH